MTRRWLAATLLVVLACPGVDPPTRVHAHAQAQAPAPAQAPAQTQTSFAIRGKPLTLRIYGKPGGQPVVAWSGDGGWLHLGPHAAEVLARAGYFVVGVDSKQYLSAFTSGATTLRQEEVAGDVLAVVRYAVRQPNLARPILVGVSEGAGLSVLAATDSTVQAAIRGVVGLGLPDINELGWRWRDSLIYLTKKVPNEPTFSVAAIIEKVSPVPLAALHATADEYVPVADIRRMMDKAREPKRLWIITALNHRFGGNETEFDARLLEAIAWVVAQK